MPTTTRFPALESVLADMTGRDRYIVALALETSVTPLLRALAADLHAANTRAERERAALEADFTTDTTPDPGRPA
ncbi:hypothetical protein ACGFRG_15210 [Streptomyces sp. NPDC048696]|uniref:hypothetical protein n=1 Tax=Streptomyces sp. NPDC048696 TaxID=3365585 RepID=UPI003721BD5C